MGPAARLQLGQEMTDVALDRLLREEEPNADLAVHEAVRDQLEHLDLAGGRLLLELLERSLERDDFCDRGIPARGDGLEPGRVLAVARQDLVPLCGVHVARIGIGYRGFRAR